jgi:uncharacterized membrane protein
MTTTAWRFPSTEGADDAVLKLKQLDSQKLIDLQDIAVIRWPQHASKPTTQEHVTVEGGMVSALAHKIRHGNIDGSMIDSVEQDMRPGTSAVVLLSSDAAIEPVIEAFRADRMELIRSDLAIEQEDQLRSAFS